MTFTSLIYLLFVPAVLMVYTLVPMRFRWAVLLVASYLFYAWLGSPHLLVVLAGVTALSYTCGSLIGRSTEPATRRLWLWTGIGLNLLILFWMKYLPFLLENVSAVLHVVSSSHVTSFKMTPLVAIGVSYYVFQGISYLLDIYFEVLEPEKHAGRFALYISLFPKLLQGPIERGGSLLPQLRELPPITADNLRAGAQLFVWGMFKKVVVADRLASFVDPVYGNVHGYSGIALVVATYLFALQLFFDFSGYTDMALGVGRCFNLRLTQNFNAPYLATSVAEFWRRWHISFSSWILDYIFKPLQFTFRQWPRWGTPLALLVTFLASGLWHGASWNFVAWGGIHGVLLAGNVLLAKQKRKFYKKTGIEKHPAFAVWQVVVTFHLVCFSWIFFRASNLKDAWYVSVNAVTGLPASLKLLLAGDARFVQQLVPDRSPGELVAVLLIILLIAGSSRLSNRFAGEDSTAGPLQWLDRAHPLFRGIVFGCITYLITFCGASTQSFIYLQF